MEKTIKAIVSSLISLGLLILAVYTCPTEEAHKAKVTATVKKEIQRRADLSLSNADAGPVERAALQALVKIAKTVVPRYVKNHLIVDELWLFSIGTINTDGTHFLSFGVFNTVFVFPMYMDEIVNDLLY
jgi:hypothetical protein